jgi:tetratricopeptide (TPR) repeat protein
MKGKHVSILLACILLACLVPVMVTAESAANLVVKGNQLFDEGKYQDAIAAYNDSIAQEPNMARAWAGKGYALNALKDYVNALPAFDRAIAITPNYGKAVYEKGNALYGLGRYEDAIIAYDEAVKIYPEYAYLAYYGKAKALQELTRYNEALTFYDKALTLKPDYAPAWNYKGETLVALGRYDEASQTFDKAIALDPNLKVAILNRQNLTAMPVTGTQAPPVSSPQMVISKATSAEQTAGISTVVRPQETNTQPTKASFSGVFTISVAIIAVAAVIRSRRS